MSEEDLYATLKLAIIPVIVLPFLTDKTYGLFDVLNPRLIWYMVILVSGISFVEYILIKVYGEGKGISITGLLGGMVYSTAVAYSLSKRSNENALAGLTSVDAIVLSLAGLAGANVSSNVAVTAVIIATISNNIVKAFISFVTGLYKLKKHIYTGPGIITAISFIYLIFILA